MGAVKDYDDVEHEVKLYALYNLVLELSKIRPIEGKNNTSSSWDGKRSNVI